MYRVRSRWQGFTLIELMIVVAIIGIIASIAYPSYQDSVMTSRRADATSALLQLQMDQEKHRANFPVYAGSVMGAANAGGLSWPSDETTGGYYTIRITANDAGGFTATATAITGKSQANDALCTTITVNQDGAAGALPSLACW